MRRILSAALALFVCPAFAQVAIELNWKPLEASHSYMVKFTPLAGGEALYFTSSVSELKETLAAGRYDVRIRSRAGDTYGKWSSPTVVEVLAQGPAPLSPAPKAVLEAKKKSRDDLEFAWSPVGKGKTYAIKIWSNDTTDKIFNFTTAATRKSLNVPTGREYTWQVGIVAKDFVYFQEPRLNSFVLLGPKLITPADIQVVREKQERVIKWKPVEGAEKYHALLQFRFLDHTEFGFLKEGQIVSNEWRAGSLKAGAYRLELTAKSPRRADSAKVVHEFVVKPSLAEL